jgi:hypothetical protein
MKRKTELRLQVGDVLEIGVESSKACGLDAVSTIALVEGVFDYENGLYTETQTAPSLWDEKRKEFDSIYHLFGNDLEDFLDSKVLKNAPAGSKEGECEHLTTGTAQN